ncbi:MAG TPA: [LysW]-aminoadipate kinase [Thermoplasmata archaeon]|nr:[LysW]-aminoadipate kinase [Thermoplasmata archaeon]
MTLVVKVGGAAGNRIDPLLDEVAGRPDVVLVHGGSDEVDRLGETMGRPAEYYTSPSGVVSRRSDPAHLEVVVLALAGKVQTTLVAGLGARGVRAVGLSGVDGRLVLAHRKSGVRAVVDGRTILLNDDLSGTIEKVDGELLRALVAVGLVPVVGPPAVTATGEIVNVDADRVAAAVAGALHADALILLTNVPGLLERRDDPSSRIPRIPSAEIDRYLPLALGRMRKKLLAAKSALADGVPRVVIAPSGVPTPIASALGGAGTVIA